MVSGHMDAMSLICHLREVDQSGRFCQFLKSFLIRYLLPTSYSILGFLYSHWGSLALAFGFARYNINIMRRQCNYNVNVNIISWIWKLGLGAIFTIILYANTNRVKKTHSINHTINGCQSCCYIQIKSGMKLTLTGSGALFLKVDFHPPHDTISPWFLTV